MWAGVLLWRRLRRIPQAPQHALANRHLLAARPAPALSCLLQRVRTTADICRMAALRHAVWADRIAWIHRVAGTLLLVDSPRSNASSSTCAGAPAAGPGGSGGGSEASLECRVFLAAWQLLLLVLSLLMAGWLEPAVAPPPPPPAPAAPATAGPRQWRWKQSIRRAWAWLQRANYEAEATLRHLTDTLAGKAWRGVVQVAAWALVLSVVWALAWVLELPELTLPPTAA